MVNNPWITQEGLDRLQEEKAEGFLSQVHFVPWIALGCDFVPLVLNVHIQLLRHVYSC